MASEGSEINNHIEGDRQSAEREKQISTLLNNTDIRYLLIQKVTEGSHVVEQHTPSTEDHGRVAWQETLWPQCSQCNFFAPFPLPQSPYTTPMATQVRNQSLHGSAFWLVPHVNRARRLRGQAITPTMELREQLV